MMYWEQVSPSHVGKGGFAPIMRLAGVIGVGAGFMLFYQRSISMFTPGGQEHPQLATQGVEDS